MNQNAEASNPPPLRVGLLLDGFTVASWVERMLARIDASPSADITHLVLRQNPPPEQGERTGRQRSPRAWLQSTIQQYGAPTQGSAFEPCSIENRCADVPCLRLTAAVTDTSIELAAADIERIRALDIDVLLLLVAGWPDAGGASLARYGTWSLLAADGHTPLIGDTAAGFREVIEDEPTTGAQLSMQSGGPETRSVLARTRTETHPTLVATNRETLMWGALSLVPRELERLHRLGNAALPAAPAGQGASQAAAAFSPGAPRLARHLLHLLAKRLKRSIRYRLFQEHWHLRYAFGEEPSTAFRQFESLVPSRDRYWADPMPLFHEGHWHIFFEDLPEATDKGHISMISFDDHHRPLPPRTVLERPYHLSYPFVFHWDQRLWMIPETASNRAVELYECTEFPDQWELRRRILEDHYIVDATLERHDGRWYLFGNQVENPGASSWTELFLFVNEGDLLDGAWTPHPDNPIRSDVRCARPAGPLYRTGESLLRPSQDCSRRYGGGMTLHEINELGPERYSEQIVNRIQPDWEPDLKGAHTYSHRPGLTVIDVMKEVPRPGLFGRLPEPVQRRVAHLLAARRAADDH